MTQRNRATFDLLWFWPGLEDGWRVEYTLLLFRMLRLQLWPLGWPAFSALSAAPSVIIPFHVLGAVLGYMYWWFIVVKAMKVTLLAKEDIFNIHHELLLLSCQLPFSLFSFNNHSKIDANPDILERKKGFYSKRQRSMSRSDPETVALEKSI